MLAGGSDAGDQYRAHPLVGYVQLGDDGGIAWLSLSRVPREAIG